MSPVFVSTGSDFFIKKEKQMPGSDKMWKIVDFLADKKRVNKLGEILRDLGDGKATGRLLNKVTSSVLLDSFGTRTSPPCPWPLDRLPPKIG
jgi:hypothetical protein